MGILKDVEKDDLLSRMRVKEVAVFSLIVLIAVVAKMAAPMFLNRWNSGPIIALLAFIGVAIMQWPLPIVFALLAPVSVAFAWFKR